MTFDDRMPLIEGTAGMLTQGKRCTMRMIDLVIKDLMQIFRDKRSLIFLVGMPIIFTVFIGFTYRSSEDEEPQDKRMSLAWVETGPVGGLGQMLHARLEDSDALVLQHMTQDTALESLKEGKVDGVLMIPSGFGKMAEGVLTGGQSSGNPMWQIKLIADTASIKAGSLYRLLRVVVSHLMSAVEIGEMSADSLGDPAEFPPALKLAWEEWGKNHSDNLVRVEQTEVQNSGSWFGDNPYNQASPGIMVQFAIMGLVTSAQILVRERESRTLQRQMTTSLKPWQILIGHMLGMFIVVFLQSAMLMIFGQLILDVNYGRDLASVLLVAMSLGLWVSSVGLLIGLLAKGNDQVILFSMVAMFFFSALGGAWFPIETAGKVFVTIGKMLPSTWAMAGFQNILIRGQGLSSVWHPAGILLAFTLGFFIISVWRFRKMEV
jgi:ABC-2 type transport system permease protein